MSDEDFPQRRADDRAALGLVYTLTERVSTVIQRFDDYAKSQEAVQTKIREKLDDHEEMVIKALTSWKWFAAIVSALSGVTVGLFVWGYTEFTALRTSVVVHHVEAAQFIKKQEAINEAVEEQIKLLMGAGRGN
jgi:hypothetical protein